MKKIKVRIMCEFVVEPVEDEEDAFDAAMAKAAASEAAHNFLSLCKVSGYSTDTDEVTVHVDGFGECRVSIGGDHD